MANSITVNIPLTVTISIGEIEFIDPEEELRLEELRIEEMRLEELRIQETKRHFQNKLNNQLGKIVGKICDL